MSDRSQRANDIKIYQVDCCQRSPTSVWGYQDIPILRNHPISAQYLPTFTDEMQTSQGHEPRLLPTIHPALSNVYWFNPISSYIKQSLRSGRSQFFMVDSLLKGHVLLLDSISQAKSARQS